MQPTDPYAASSGQTTYGMPAQAKVQAYPDGYYEPVTSLDFVRMVTSPFKSPNWIMNLVWMFVCQVASVIVVGNLVAWGYLAEVAESRSGGRSENWPDFNPDRFTDYLMRGLWPFLWNLIWTIPLMLIMGIPIFSTIGLSSFLMGNYNEVPGIIVAITGGLVSAAICIVALLAMMASMFHSGLGNDFGKGADLNWIGSYISKMGLTTVLVGIVYSLVGTVLGWAGILFFCVGILAVGPLMNLMAGDIGAQLHDIFVSRGGVSAFDASHLDTDVIEAQVII